MVGVDSRVRKKNVPFLRKRVFSCPSMSSTCLSLDNCSPPPPSPAPLPASILIPPQTSFEYTVASVVRVVTLYRGRGGGGIMILACFTERRGRSVRGLVCHPESIN